jgi:hypothetical protein
MGQLNWTAGTVLLLPANPVQKEEVAGVTAVGLVMH